MNSIQSDLPTDLQTQPQAVPYELACGHCGTKIFTHCDADLTDRKTAEIVAMLARSKMLCRPCKDIAEGKSETNLRWSRSQEWARICPANFRETRAAKLKRPEMLDLVLGWTYGPNGLLLHGVTGSGKSRCAWKLCEREFMRGKTFAGMDYRFAEKYAALMNRAGAGAVFDWLEEMVRADLLLMDDVLKSKMTDAVEMALFNVLTTRTETQRPVIVTSNDTGDSLLSRLSPDRGAPFVRRLREFCKAINFK